MEIAKETHIEKPKKYTENIFGYKVRTLRDFEALTRYTANNICDKIGGAKFQLI